MLNFCTLFDSGYLARGIALYDSLVDNCEGFHLYVLALDDSCLDYLRSKKYSNLSVISLFEFEDEDLLRVKKERTKVEYYWTCSSSLLDYCLKTYQMDICTYLDADLYFYNDPKVLLDELGDNDVMITEHRYIEENDLTRERGRFNVQFMTFRNNANGIEVLGKWRQDCIDWCYDKVDNGRFGDQKYLDAWPEKHQGIHIMKHLGGGMATWNINQYKLVDKDHLIFEEVRTKKRFDIIFFHFHGVRFYENNTLLLSVDELKNEVKEQVYVPYIKKLIFTDKEIRAVGFKLNSLGKKDEKRNNVTFRDLIYILRKEYFRYLMTFKFKMFFNALHDLIAKYRNENYYSYSENEIVNLK